MCHERPPDDFAAMTELVRDLSSDVQVIICGAGRYGTEPFLILPVPIQVPPISTRTDDLPRIIDEYALDAIAALGARPDSFTAEDREWVIHHAASTFSDVEKATLRLVALRMSESIASAAALLGMKRVSLERWLGRREVLPRS